MQYRVFGFRLRVAVLGSLVLASTGWAVRASGQSRSASVNELVAGFNAIGDRATELRSAMRPNDAEAFDAVMRDIMSILVSLPGIALRTPHDPRKIVPPRPRADRIGQLKPDLDRLERFFGRLSRTTDNPEAGQMFEQAQASVKKMQNALSVALPIVDFSAPTLAENEPQ